MAAAEDRRPVPPAFAQALRELGLAGDDEALVGAPLAGGVSSDIWRIDTARGPVCAKRALAKLRVAADWRAPVERSRYEARWIAAANAARPGCAPQLLGQHDGCGVVAMAWLDPADHPLWKAQLLAGRIDAGVAAAVGATLAAIHTHAARRPALAADFDSAAIFHEIRLAPYLVATAERHPALADRLHALVAQTQANARTLVHGDVSPKNIVVGPRGPVLLDAECATWGDPAFDVAFVLNHLLLKTIPTPSAARTAACAAAYAALVDAYFAGVDWEPRGALEARAASLLPGLLLARVDGKSPVEYVTRDDQRDAIRGVASALLARPVARLADVAAAWRNAWPGDAR